jgi:hypothetical protein
LTLNEFLGNIERPHWPNPTDAAEITMSCGRSSSRWKPTGLASVLVFLPVVIVTGILSGCTQTRGEANPNPNPTSDQVRLLSSIVNDRKHLFNGVLMYLPLKPMAVESTKQFRVKLIAVGQNSAAVKIPKGKVVGSRSLKVGGVEQASLSNSGGGVSISPVGPTRVTIAEPGDSVTWTWDITAEQPGDYTLNLVVITYQGTSDRVLTYINRPVPINLKVRDTWSHRAKSSPLGCRGSPDSS